MFQRRAGSVFGPAFHDATLVEPAVQASLLGVSPGRTILARSQSHSLCQPQHTAARANMTVRPSYDEGETWPVARSGRSRSRGLQRPCRPGGWRDRAALRAGNAGGIVYASFTLAWLTDGKDSLPQ